MGKRGSSLHISPTFCCDLNGFYSHWNTTQDGVAAEIVHHRLVGQIVDADARVSLGN